ncbi:MAG: hypothetical protein ACE37K_12845 [Planctomycetota bacterium]
MSRSIVCTALSVVALSAAAEAQATRVYLNGTPSNLLVDWGLAAVVPGVQPDSFVAVLPIGDLAPFMRFEPDASMDLSFGAGNWLRCTMRATNWGYLSGDACAHQPAAGASSPYSLLTTSYDWGMYDETFASLGAQLFPGLTAFPTAPASVCQGLSGWTFENWQLRTRGFALNNLWNACPGSASVDPNFGGYVGAEFSYGFQ